MKRTFALLLAAILFAAVLAGCSSQQNEPAATEKEFTIGRAYDATTLDCAKMDDDGSYLLMNLLGEGLVRNDNGFLSPGVAERWEQSEDGRELTFYLREDAKWSDGEPLTAQDFQYSFLRTLDPNGAYTNASYAYIFANGEKYNNGEASAEDVGVKALDDHTLKITMEQPGLDTLYDLARYPFFPVQQKTVEAQSDTYGSDGNIVSNGAFRLTEWSRENRLVMEKNEYYWNKDAIHLDCIINRVNITEDTASDMLQSGELDAYEFATKSKVDALTESGFDSTPYLSGYQFVHMNSNGSSDEAKRFMSNTNFRRALNYVVNRQGITNSVYPGAEPANRLTAPTVSGVNGLFNEEYPFEAWPVTGDPEKAKECLNAALEELNATVDDIPELSLLVMDGGGGMLVMQAVQDMLLSTLNIRSHLDPQPLQSMLEKRRAGDWDLWWGGASIGALDWASPSTVAYRFDSADNTMSNGYYNAKFDELYEACKTTMDLKERKDTLFEMEKVLCDDPGSILIGWLQRYCVLRSGTTGMMIQSDMINYTYLDIAN